MSILVGILGKDVADPDDVPSLEAMPKGFACFQGSLWYGEHESFAIVDAKIVVGRKKLTFTMSRDQAQDMVDALNNAIGDCDELMIKPDVEASDDANEKGTVLTFPAAPD